MSDLSKLSAIVVSIQSSLATQDGVERGIASEWRAFGRAVRAERNRRKISIRKMALAVGITKSSLDYRERGICAWTVPEAKRAIKYFEAVKVEAPADTAAIEAP